MTDETLNYDVLVIGTGNAACCAALAALDEKASVGIIEKAPKKDRGGNSSLTTHMRFVYNGIDDLRPLVKNMSEAELQKQIDRLPHRTEAEIWDDFIRVTNGQVDQAMLQVHVAESLKTVHGLAGKQIDLSALVIRGMEKTGLAWDVRRPAAAQVDRRRAASGS